jgi:hypothetical protein
MAQVASHWPLTLEAWASTHVSLYGTCGGQTLGQVFAEFFSFPLSVSF